MRVLFATAIALRAVAPAFAQDDAKSYAWRYAYKAKETLRYHTEATVSGSQSGGGGDFKVVSKTTSLQYVKQIADNGDATLNIGIEAAETEFNGQKAPEDPAKRPVVTRTISKMGVLLKQEVANAPAGFDQLNLLNSIAINAPAPANPVKIGDSWKTEITNPFIKDKKITITSKLVGKETIGGVEALKVTYEAALPMSDKAEQKDFAHISGTYYPDPKEGRLLRLECVISNATVTTPDGSSATIKIQAKTELILPGSDKGAK